MIRIAFFSCVAMSSLMAQRPAEPMDGYAVLERMHAAYAGHWYSNLVFVQRTTLFKVGGEKDTATWYEALKGPDALRIDLGVPRAGRGIITTAESSFVFRDSQPIRVVADGNPFLPFVMGAYLQPVARTAEGASHHGFDLQRMFVGAWEGHRTYVVGATDVSDTTAPEFWVDAERLVLVRMRVPLKTGGSQLDIRLGGYVPVGDGWLATHVEISREGKPIQFEDYLEWSDGIVIPDSLFNRTRWVSGGHWADAPRTGPVWHHRSE